MSKPTIQFYFIQTYLFYKIKNNRKHIVNTYLTSLPHLPHPSHLTYLIRIKISLRARRMIDKSLFSSPKFTISESFKYIFILAFYPQKWTALVSAALYATLVMTSKFKFLVPNKQLLYLRNTKCRHRNQDYIEITQK